MSSVAHPRRELPDDRLIWLCSHMPPDTFAYRGHRRPPTDRSLSDRPPCRQATSIRIQFLPGPSAESTGNDGRRTPECDIVLRTPDYSRMFDDNGLACQRVWGRQIRGSTVGGN